MQVGVLSLEHVDALLGRADVAYKRIAGLNRSGPIQVGLFAAGAESHRYEFTLCAQRPPA